MVCLPLVRRPRNDLSQLLGDILVRMRRGPETNIELGVGSTMVATIFVMPKVGGPGQI